MKLLSLLSGILILLLSACAQKDATFFPSSNTLYFNSFETSDETRGLDHYLIKEDAPKKGGKHSLSICGGCIVPSFELDAFMTLSEDTPVKLKLWGKTDAGMTGAISLVVDGNLIVFIDIESSKWKAYESETVIIPANQPIQFFFYSGGFVPVTTYYDMIEVVKDF
ncbi:MAG: hypothetical protein R2795_08465 [Saprospiraceae bacterium]